MMRFNTNRMVGMAIHDSKRLILGDDSRILLEDDCGVNVRLSEDSLLLDDGLCGSELVLLLALLLLLAVDDGRM